MKKTSLILYRIVVTLFGKPECLIEGDPKPLQFLYNFMMVFYKTAFMKSIIHFTFFFFFVVILIVLRYLMVTGHKLKIADLALFFMGIYPAMIYILYVFSYEESKKLMLRFARRTRPLYNDDEMVQRKIKKTSDYLRIVIIFMIFLSLGVGVLLLPIFGDELEMNIVFKATRYYYYDSHPKVYYTVVVILQVLFFHGTLVTINFTFAVTYVCFEVEFQLILLQSSIKNVVNICYKEYKKHGHEVCKYQDLQKYIRAKLVDCIRHYNHIKASKTEVNQYMFYPMLIMVYAGVFILCFQMVFLILRLSPKSDLRVFWVLITTFASLGVLVEGGQKLTNASEDLYKIASTFPTYALNKENKLILKIMTDNFKHILLFYCLQGISLDYTLTLKLYQGVYTVLSFSYQYLQLKKNQIADRF